MEDVKIDKRTKEYRETVNYDFCNDPHGIGCREALESLESGRPRVFRQAAPCPGCVNRNLKKYVDADGVVRDMA